jgi:ABC-2 type transport system ATP-binding protein
MIEQETATPMLVEARGLTKRYPKVTALDNLNLELASGIIGLVGANGAGKSTFIKLLLGLIEPTSGSVRVMGMDAIAQGHEVRQFVGYMPEHDCLPSDVSATEFVAHMGQVSGLPRSAARERTAEILRHVGLFEERYRPIGGYSTGMRQRVKLAQALVHDPVLIFLDEPVSGLDPAGRDEMLGLIRKTHREFGISLLLSSHIMGDVERTCDRILVLEDGRVVHQGEVSAFTRETETIYVEVTARQDEFLSALRDRQVESSLEGTTVVVPGVADAGYDLIRDALVASGAPLRRMAPHRRTLVELFRDGDVADEETDA